MNAIMLTSLLLTAAVRTHAQGFNPSTPQPSPPAAELRAGTSYGAGLLREEGEADLAKSADAYRQVIQAFERQREGPANAIFRLGEVYRKMGRREEAKVQYARILREFPDLVRLTELSHGYLLGDRPEPTRAPRGVTVGRRCAKVTGSLTSLPSRT